MHPRALQVLACPECRSPLVAQAAREAVLESGSLVCTRDGSEFPVVDGIPRLFRRDRLASVSALAEEYSRIWRRDGWAPTSPANLRELPYRDPSGGTDAKWRLKARSLDAVLPIFDAIPHGKVADLGAGTGWLSRRLAARLLDVYAVDIVLDSTLGLGAAAAYLQDDAPFECVGGEIEYLPFRDGSLDAVVCNASLHYASSLTVALSEVDRVLRTGGRAVVMNSPVHRDARSAARAERDFRNHLRELGASEAMAGVYHHLVREPLLAALTAEIGPTSEQPYDPGRSFRWVRRGKGIALGMELAAFPVLVARKGPTPS